MNFIPGMIPPPGGEDISSLWFVFRGNELLVEWQGDMAAVPSFEEGISKGLKTIRPQFLGTLDGRHCYAAECDSKVSTMDNMAFAELRGLFSRIEDNVYRVAIRAMHMVTWNQNHQFCGRCGAPTVNDKHELAKCCPKCHLNNYPRISPAVIVAVVKDDKLLLARAHRFPTVMYSVLAGFVEPGETLEDCVIREVREETGIDVKDITYFGSQPWPFPDSLMIAFTTTYAGGEIRIEKKEIAHADWFSASNLPKIPGKLSIARQLIDWFADQNH